MGLARSEAFTFALTNLLKIWNTVRYRLVSVIYSFICLTLDQGLSPSDHGSCTAPTRCASSMASVSRSHHHTLPRYSHTSTVQYLFSPPHSIVKVRAAAFLYNSCSLTRCQAARHVIISIILFTINRSLAHITRPTLFQAFCMSRKRHSSIHCYVNSLPT